MRPYLFALLLGALPVAAHAQSQDAPMAAWEALEALPPRNAWDVAVQVDYASLAWHQEAPWIGFGVRGGWGRLINPQHRLGIAAGLAVEGPVPIYWSLAVEPQVTWDRVTDGLLIGASVGPSFMLHSRLEDVGTKRTPTVGPMVAARVGYSERWSRAGRRFFAYFEPKLRMMVNDSLPVADWSIALVVGSGRGM